MLQNQLRVWPTTILEHRFSGRPEGRAFPAQVKFQNRGMLFKISAGRPKPTQRAAWTFLVKLEFALFDTSRNMYSVDMKHFEEIVVADRWKKIQKKYRGGPNWDQ